MGGHATYTTEIIEDGNLVLTDIGPWDQHPTITNDAEYVIAMLHRAGTLSGSTRVFYWDSESEYGELLHDGNGKFIGFS